MAIQWSSLEADDFHQFRALRNLVIRV